jgi:hypothetical protein
LSKNTKDSNITAETAATEDEQDDNEIGYLIDVLYDEMPIIPYKPQNEAESSGLVYFTGYLARKTDSTDHFVKNNNEVQDAGFVQSKWLDLMNTGGLAYPSKELCKDVLLMEAYFRQYHEKSKDGLIREKGVVRKLSEQIHAVLPQYKYKLIQKCVLSRTCFRIRQLNNNNANHVESARSKHKSIEHMY